MANKYDARPFTDLQKDAEEFQAKFVEDIENCKSILDSKITSLICDPDSLGNSRGPKQNALIEFSKAKYEIYIGMKSLMNDMEREWLKYIAEMKKLFIDNVEVFLANTKLEVKLPSVESPGPKKSLASKSAGVTGSFYPIISSITKSIPGFTQKTKPFDHEMNENEVERDVSKSWSTVRQNSKLNVRVNVECSPAKNEISEDEDEDVDMEKPSSLYDNAKVQKIPSPAMKQSNQQNTTSSEEELSENECGISEDRTNSDESEEVIQTVRSNRKNNMASKTSNRKQPSKRQTNSRTTLEERINNSYESEEALETVTSNKKKVSSKASKRKELSKCPTNSKTISRDRDNDSESEEVLETVSSNKKNVSSKASKRKGVAKRMIHSKNAEEEIVSVPECEENFSKTSRFLGRQSRRKTVNQIDLEREKATSAEHDIYDMETSVAPIRSVTRRKTLLPNLKDIELGSDIIPDTRISARSKRKTIVGVSDFASDSPSKRLKSSNTQKKYTESEGAVTDDNLLEISDSYSQWIPLNGIDSSIPTTPGIYEVKVWRAKKSAYIGSCESLRQMLTLHKLKQNSGHKHLDKFIERNYGDIQIRYEVVPSVNHAKVEVKNRVNGFVALHKTTPAYN